MASANQMRSKIEANEYKDYILGFIFYKYLSDKEVRFLKENDYDDEYLKLFRRMTLKLLNGYRRILDISFPTITFFSTWIELGRDFDVSNVRDALSAFSRFDFKYP